MVPYIYKLVADYLERRNKRNKRNKANNAAPTVVESTPVVEPEAVEPEAVEPTEEIVVDEK